MQLTHNIKSDVRLIGINRFGEQTKHNSANCLDTYDHLTQMTTDTAEVLKIQRDFSPVCRRIYGRRSLGDVAIYLPLTRSLPRNEIKIVNHQTEKILQIC